MSSWSINKIKYVQFRSTVIIWVLGANPSAFFLFFSRGRVSWFISCLQNPLPITSHALLNAQTPLPHPTTHLPKPSFFFPKTIERHESKPRPRLTISPSSPDFPLHGHCAGLPNGCVSPKMLGLSFLSPRCECFSCLPKCICLLLVLLPSTYWLGYCILLSLWRGEIFKINGPFDHVWPSLRPCVQ